MLTLKLPSAGGSAGHRCDAISLIEVLTVLAVSVIILITGMPSVAQWMRAMDIHNSASDLVAVLQGARAEALARNQEVSVTLGDAQGRAVWTMGCVLVTTGCPQRLRGVDVPGVRYARWAASASASMPALTVPLQAGLRMPAQVTFNAYGAAPATGSVEISRIDVSHAADPSARRLVVLMAVSGMVRLCDPQAATGQPLSCG